MSKDNNKYKNVKRVRKYLIIIIIMLVFNILYTSFITRQQPIYDKNVDESSHVTIGQIAESTIITQTFVCERDKLKALEIKTANYDRKNKTELLYTLEDGDGNVIINGMLDASDAGNFEFYEINFDKEIESKNKKLTLKISDNNTADGSGITFLSTAKIGDAKLNVEGAYAEPVDENNSLVMRLITASFDIETFIIILFFGIFIIGFTKMLYKFLR